MKKICVFIPTMDRSECIDAYLNEVLEDASKWNIDFYIFDTSTNDNTREIVEEYSKQHNNLFYRFYDNYPDKTTDLKVVEGFAELKSRYDYIWLCGDGCILMLNKWMPLITKYLEQNVNLIHFTNAPVNGEDEMNVCTDVHQYFKEYAWYATYYCATIISGDFVNVDLMKSIYPKLKNSGYLYWHYLFENLTLNQETDIVICNGQFFENNPFKKVNSSYRPGRFLNFWANNWIKAVEYLPDYYADADKEVVIKSVDNNLKLYSIDNLFALRRTENLNKALFLEYEEQFAKVTNQEKWKIKLIAYVPKWIAKMLFLSVRVVRKIKRIVKRG